MNEIILKRPENNEPKLPYDTFAEILCCVPAGYVTTKEAILGFVSERMKCVFAGIDEPVSITPIFKEDIGTPSGHAAFKHYSENPGLQPDKELLIPYWRVLSVRGNITGFEKTKYKEKLEEEGLIVNKSGRTFKVNNFKEHLFDFGNVKIKVPREKKQSETFSFESKCEIGNPIYWVEQPDYDMNNDRIMQFKIRHNDVHDIVRMIAITEDGVKYFYDSKDLWSEITEDRLGFLSRAEAKEFIDSYCDKFNRRKFKFNTIIYTEYGEEIIKEAEINANKEIVFVTNLNNKYLWTDEGRSFSFTSPVYQKYYIVRTLMNCSEINSSEIIGVYEKKQDAVKALRKYKKSVQIKKDTDELLVYKTADNDRLDIVLQIVPAKECE